MAKATYENNDGDECGLLICDVCGAEGGDKHLSVEDSYREALEAGGWIEIDDLHKCYNCVKAESN